MTKPTIRQINELRAGLEAFVRRFKLADATSYEKTLNEVDSQTLFYIEAHPGCGPTDVARFLGVATTTMSSATDRLVKRGLLQRTRLENDRRAVALNLSASGKTQVAELTKVHNSLCRTMLSRLSSSERDAFVAMIAKISSDEH